jgi:hypothetical protein
MMTASRRVTAGQAAVISLVGRASRIDVESLAQLSSVLVRPPCSGGALKSGLIRNRSAASKSNEIPHGVAQTHPIPMAATPTNHAN